MTSTTISNRDKLLADWREKQMALTKLKIEEAELRNQVIEAFSEITEEMHAGTESIDIGWGHDLKILHKLSYTLDNANDYEATDAALDQIEEAMGDVGELLVSRLIKRKLELSVSEYKKLPANAKAIIDRVLTIKPATKSLEIKKRGR